YGPCQTAEPVPERNGLLQQQEDREAGNRIQIHTPPKNRSAIRNQQHPRQKAPCSNPMRNAPSRPDRQLPRRKPRGVRQCRKHMALSGVNCYKPAAIKMPAPSHRLVVASIGDSSRADSRPHCSAAATAQKPAQPSKYPAANKAVGTSGAPADLSLRLTRANRRSIGAALGSIIATIITHHMAKIRAA